MKASTNSDIYTYHFVEIATKRTLGIMRVRADMVEKRHAPEGAWTTTKNLDDILEGGISPGLEFSFPDQGANELSTGVATKFYSIDCMPYGSLDGRTINIGCVAGLIKEYDNDNMLMVMTFTPYGVGYPSYGSSVTTMFNNAIEGGTGLIQWGTDPDEQPEHCKENQKPKDENEEQHGKKYVYLGIWKRVW